MSWGFKIINAKNSMVIDDNFKNFAYLTSGSQALVAGINYISCSASSLPKVMFIQPTTIGYVVVVGLRKSGTDYNAFMVVSDTAQTINYSIYAPGQVVSIPAGGYGLLVYNAAGEIVFSSYDKFAKIVNLFTKISYPSGYNQPETSITVSNTSVNYYNLYAHVDSCYFTNGLWTNYTLAFRRISLTSLGIKFIPWFQRANPHPSSGELQMSQPTGTNLLEVGPP